MAITVSRYQTIPWLAKKPHATRWFFSPTFKLDDFIQLHANPHIGDNLIVGEGARNTLSLSKARECLPPKTWR